LCRKRSDVTIRLAANEVTALELAQELESGSAEVVVLDVRASGEVARWKVEGDRDVPRVERAYWDVLGSPDVLAAGIPDGAIAVVVCAYGNTSAIIAEELRAIGVDARNLDGGMVAWSRLHMVRPLPGTPEGTYVVQLDRVAKGCLSYVVGTEGGPAIVIDPDRFHDDHRRVLHEHGSTLEAVIDTHLHADHVSGAAALAAHAGVPYLLADDDGATVDHRRPDDGEVILRAGGLTAQAVALHAPGHTPGSTAVLVDRRYLFSGDTLFVVSVGRPDLGGQVEAWATDLHRTLTARLAGLADDVLVLPAHYQDRRERNDDGVFAARLGDLRRHTEFTADLDAFLAHVRADVREAPAEYARIRLVNLGGERSDAEVLDELETGKNQCAASRAGSP
jgi:glyoxylase-like metal-dependent hydrolase (beta-lactamase superfamily II)